MLSKQIVIARYNEDVAWAQGMPAIVYNKGEDFITPLEKRPLPNLGRESQTYLHHITMCWDRLADITLFCQGRITDHLPPGMRPESLLADAAEDIVVPVLISMREWGLDGRIQFIPGIHKNQIESGAMKRASLSLVDFFRIHLNLELNSLGSVVFTPGAIFAVKRQCIQRRPLEFYKRLLATVDHHVNPEEGHYLERSWLYIFGVGVSSFSCRSMPPRR
jgi:hypothetical protein